MTDTIENENLDHLDPIEKPVATENTATAETTEISNVAENAEASVTETQPVTNSDSAETSAAAETSNAPVTAEAPTTENSATTETTEPKLCGTDPKIICDVVNELFQTPKPKEEPKLEEPTRSLEFQTTRNVSKTVVPKVPVQYVENPLKFAKDLKKPTALDKIKDVADNLKLIGKEVEGEFIVKAFDNITNPTLERKEFEIKDTEELAKAFFGREKIVPKEPGALHSGEFTISENAEPGKSFQDDNAGTVADKVIDSAYGTVAAQVKFDMLQELRERVYHAKFELDKVVGVKGELFDSLNCSLKKAEEILNVERSNIVKHNLEEITKTLEAVKVEDLAPEDRKALWDAIHNLKCAINLVNKSGFKDKAGDAEKLVQEQVAKALKLYPKLKEDVRMQALASQIFALSE
jgi:hypothetical protein|nr:MAG TPA: hypothetical protein [Caudoviricetes sp.]